MSENISGNISQITLPSGGTYNIKDVAARDDIATLQLNKADKSQITALQAAIARGFEYVGQSEDASLTDGSTTKAITVTGLTNYTPQSGDLVIKGNSEYIWSDATNSWREFGSTGSLKSLAFKDNASTNYTPAGNIDAPTFTGIKATGLTVSPANSGTVTYTPEGSVTQPTFTGTAGTATATYTPAGGVTVKAGTSTNYTPAGTVSQPTFTGTATTIVVNQVSSGTTTYTPDGRISQPGITVTPSTTTVNSITAIGTLPELTTTVSNENLTIGFNQGTLPTKGSNTSVMTSATAALNEAPSFTGTGVRLTASYTPEGSVSKPTFSGTEVALSGSFSGTQATINSSYTPQGSVSQPTFSGEGKRLVVEDYTPQGMNSAPAFHGTATTITVS